MLSEDAMLIISDSNCTIHDYVLFNNYSVVKQQCNAALIAVKPYGHTHSSKEIRFFLL